MLKLRFGLEDGRARTLEEVGKRIQGHARTHSPDRGEGTAQAAPSEPFAEAEGFHLMHEKSISLDSRLKCIAELIGKCAPLCRYRLRPWAARARALLQHHWVTRSVTDISDASLSKARTLIRLLGLDMRAHFLVCDGLQGLETMRGRDRNRRHGRNDDRVDS